MSEEGVGPVQVGRRRGCGLGLIVELLAPRGEDPLHGAVGGVTGLEGERAGGVQALGPVAVGEAQDALGAPESVERLLVEQVRMKKAAFVSG